MAFAQHILWQGLMAHLCGSINFKRVFFLLFFLLKSMQLRKKQTGWETTQYTTQLNLETHKARLCLDAFLICSTNKSWTSTQTQSRPRAQALKLHTDALKTETLWKRQYSTWLNKAEQNQNWQSIPMSNEGTELTYMNKAPSLIQIHGMCNVMGDCSWNICLPTETLRYLENEEPHKT